LQQIAQGQHLGALTGGLLVTLDLSKAFDMVPRGHLFRCLSILGVPDVLLDFLNAIYHQTDFTFQHRGQTRNVETSKGIRQGCKAAPTLWAAYATGLLLEIWQHTDAQWLYECITMYADDGCMHEVVTSPEQFRCLLRKVGTTLDLLEAAQLTINLEKTPAMRRLVGPLSTCAQRLFVKRGKRGGAWLKIPRRNGTITHIRLVKHIQYLGATLSYYNFERQTMLARIKAGDKTSQQLTRWLHSQKGFNISQKMGLETVYICLH
jgi:hypothetical protein